MSKFPAKKQVRTLQFVAQDCLIHAKYRNEPYRASITDSLLQDGISANTSTQWPTGSRRQAGNCNWFGSE